MSPDFATSPLVGTLCLGPSLRVTHGAQSLQRVVLGPLHRTHHESPLPHGCLGRPAPPHPRWASARLLAPELKFTGRVDPSQKYACTSSRSHGKWGPRSTDLRQRHSSQKYLPPLDSANGTRNTDKAGLRGCLCLNHLIRELRRFHFR